MLSFISSAFARPTPPSRSASASTAVSPAVRGHVHAHPFARSAFVGAAVLSALAPALVLNRRSASADSSLPRSAPSAMSSLSDLQGLKTIDGTALDASAFKGKVVFAMNVASACGYTRPGYDLFKQLTDKYDAADFVAVAIPCNAFGRQESGSPEEVQTFALARADKLLITEKAEVNGESTHPIVELAKTKFPGKIGWNFDGRFVFDRNGVPVSRFSNSASATEIEAAIDKCL